MRQAVLVPLLAAVALAATVSRALAVEAATAGEGQGTILFFLSVFLFLTLAICARAARRATDAHEYLAASSSISIVQNGLAIAGDYMSAGAFLGLTGAIFASGLDGMFLAASCLASWPIVLLVVSEPLRRLGKYSIADVLTHRLKERPVRILAATCSLVITVFYLFAQMVGGGELVGLLFGVSYRWAIVGGGASMIAFSAYGGMRGATWVQIIKAVLMLGGAAVIAVGALRTFGFDFGALFAAAERSHPRGAAIVNVNAFGQDYVATVSLGIGILFGTAGLPHILMRFFMVKDERAARVSVFYATCLIGAFFSLLVPIGYGSIAILRTTPGYLTGGGTLRGGANLAPIHLAHAVGGNLLVGFIAAVAFATILAVVAGLLIAGASSVTNDLVAGVLGRPLDNRVRLRVSRLSTAAIGLVGIVLGVLFEGQNVAYLIAMATAVAASANFPLIVLAVYWNGLTTGGAVAGGAVGLASAVALTCMGPTVWTKVLGLGPALFPFDSPALFTMPLAFLVCWGVSVLEARSAPSAVPAA